MRSTTWICLSCVTSRKCSNTKTTEAASASVVFCVWNASDPFQNELGDLLLDAVHTGSGLHTVVHGLKAVAAGDGIQQTGVGAQLGQALGQAAGLLAGTGDHDAAAVQRTLFEPAQLVMQGADLAHHDDRGIAEFVVHGGLGQGGDSGHQAALVGRGAAVDQGGRGVGIHARVQQVPGDVGQVLHAHDEDQGGGAGGQGLPVVHGTGLVRVLVAGDDGHRRGEVAVGQRDARIGRGRDGAADAGHFLKGHAGGQQFLLGDEVPSLPVLHDGSHRQWLLSYQ